MATEPTRYIRIAVNFGEGDKEMNLNLDGAEITDDIVDDFFHDARDAALVKLGTDRIRRRELS